MDSRKSQLLQPGNELGLIRGWSEWKELWKQAEHLELLQGLLHFGFKVETSNEEERRERLLFYFDIADGHASADLLCALRDDCTPGARRAVLQKAFTVLCQECFRPNKDRYDRFNIFDAFPWLRTMVSDRVILEKLLWFLRIESDGWHHRLYNLQQPYTCPQAVVSSVGVARTFALTLARLILASDWSGELQDHRIAAVDILCGLGEPGRLIDREWSSSSDLVGEDILKRLEELAPQCHISTPDECREAATIEEAALGGSKVAHTFLLLKVRNAEYERLRHISELKHQQQCAAEELKRLGH